MRKLIILTMVLACVLALAGCTQSGGSGEPVSGGTPLTNDPDYVAKESNGVPEPIDPVDSKHNWGITLSAKDVASTGLTIVCEQDEGTVKGELRTGSYYNISKQENGNWVDVEYAPQEYDVSWTGEAWSIPLNDSVEWEVDWDWLYGELPQGEYRISKSIMDYIEAGNYEEQTYYATFNID